MSRENVEVVRRMLSEFNTSHQLTEAWAPDLVWETGFPGARTTEYHGREGFYEFLEDWFSPYEDWSRSSTTSSTPGEAKWWPYCTRAVASVAPRSGSSCITRFSTRWIAV
jgi:hypothetical protein